MKKRIDLLLVDKKIAETRTKAQAMIMGGNIFINNQKVIKNGELYDEKIIIIKKNLDHEWVSRGALKLLYAFNFFEVDITNFICLDIGASTGGFTEVMLSKGAKKIYSVDVGKNQLHEKLINNSKIINIPKTNCRYLTKEIIPERVDIIVCDVSFISMKKVIEPSLRFLKEKNGIILALIKPQFELEKNEINKNGIIVDVKIHERICSDYKKWFSEKCKVKIKGIVQSPIKGQKGNIEFLIFASR